MDLNVDACGPGFLKNLCLRIFLVLIYRMSEAEYQELMDNLRRREEEALRRQRYLNFYILIFLQNILPNIEKFLGCNRIKHQRFRYKGPGYIGNRTGYLGRFLGST